MEFRHEFFEADEKLPANTLQLTVTVEDKDEHPEGTEFHLAVAMYDAEGQELHSNSAAFSEFPVSISFNHAVDERNPKPQHVTISSIVTETLPEPEPEPEAKPKPVYNNRAFDLFCAHQCFELPEIDTAVSYHHKNGGLTAEFGAECTLSLRPGYSLNAGDIKKRCLLYSAAGETPSEVELKTVKTKIGGKLFFESGTKQVALSSTSGQSYFVLTATCPVRYGDLTLPVHLVIDSRRLK